MLLQFIKKHYWFWVLLACISSRVFTTIFYLEDPDSMRFAFAIKEFDLVSLHPHFPGYALFCFIVKVINWVTGSVAYSFSIVGGISIFLIIKYSYRLAQFFFPAINIYVLSVLLFFNPLFWVLGNMYMPDLLGVALLMICSSLFVEAVKTHDNNKTLLFSLFLGFLAGVRLSYWPFFLPLALYLFFTNTNKIKLILAGALGVSVWFIPMLTDTGLENLVHTARLQSDGHFNEWGETINTRSLYWLRFEKIFETIWADGLGGFMFQRSWVTLIISGGLAIGFVSGVSKIKIKAPNKLLLLILSAIGCYFVWIYLYQNVIFKSRHILPYISFIIILVSVGWTLLLQKRKITTALFAAFILCNGIFTINIALQHKSKTAIAQTADFLAVKGKTENYQIYTTDLFSQYYSHFGSIKPNFILYSSAQNPKIISALKKGEKIFATCNIDSYAGIAHTKKYKFYHNPYINRSWSGIVIYEYN